MAKISTYRFTITVDVIDEDELRRAAEERFCEQNGGRNVDQWHTLRRSNADPVAADLHMLFDPGESPDGTDIVESEAEFEDEVVTSEHGLPR
jgi:hypothetical protein